MIQWKFLNDIVCKIYRPEPHTLGHLEENLNLRI